MKKEKISSVFYYVASVLYFLTAIICFVGDNHNSMAYVWISLGFTFLCLGFSNKKKEKEHKDDSKKE